MAAYAMIDVEVTDEALYAQYRQQVGALPADFGGRYVANTSDSEVTGGDWTPGRLILLEFPDTEQARGYVNALEAAEFREMRARCFGSRNVVVIPGL